MEPSTTSSHPTTDERNIPKLLREAADEIERLARECDVQRMADCEESDWLDKATETYIASMTWSPYATENEKNITIANIRYFASLQKERVQRIEAERDAARLVSRKRLQVLRSSGILDDLACEVSWVNDSQSSREPSLPTETTLITTPLPWRIFRMDDCDWWVARTLQEAKASYQHETGVDDESIEDASELTDEELDRLRFVDTNEAGHPIKDSRCTFREELARRVSAGLSKPELFACTEY